MIISTIFLSVWKLVAPLTFWKMLLCEFCQNIDFAQLNGKNGYRHHQSMRDLVACGSNKLCVLCELIIDQKWYASQDNSARASAQVATFFQPPAQRPQERSDEQGRVLFLNKDATENNKICVEICVFEESNTPDSSLGALANMKLESHTIVIPICTSHKGTK